MKPEAPIPPRRRPYNWFGYGAYFVCGALLGGIPIFFHFVTDSADWSMKTLVGVMIACGLLGGLI